MIENVVGNIITIEGELLINASNGKGWMGGIIGRFFPLKGVAETIHYADPTIEGLAKRESKKMKVKKGDTFHTPSGKLNFPRGILHAVTMDKPGQLSDIPTIEKCLENINRFCDEHKINTVVMPLLGTGTGRLNKEDILNLYNQHLSKSKTVFKIAHYKK